MKAWTVQNIPSQRGHQAVITGATGGLGYESALGLAAAGTQVVLTGRSATKGEAALQRIRSMHPAASISLDLASPASVQDFAERFKRSLDALDILVAEAR